MLPHREPNVQVPPHPAQALEKAAGPLDFLSEASKLETLMIHEPHHEAVRHELEVVKEEVKKAAGCL